MGRLTSLGALVAVLAVAILATPAGASGWAAQTDDGSDTPETSTTEPAESDEGGDDGGVTGGDAGFITVIEVSGLIDPLVVDLIERTLDDAERTGARYVVLNMNSPGAVVDDAELADLAARIAGSEVPVAVWIGPSGSQARGGAAQLAAVADPLGIAVGSRLGDTGASVLGDELGPPFGEHAALLRDGTIGAERAEDLGIAAAPAPTIGEFVITLPGFETQETTQEGRTGLEPRTVVRFGELDLAGELFHTVASPPVAYLLLAIGLGLIVFELYTAGVGIAGLVGAGSVVLAGYGLWVLPVRPWALALVVASFVAFSVDVQTGVPRAWTVIGFVMFVLGSLFFYDGLSVSWVTLLVAFVGIVLTYISGMPAMVRTRFSTPTIGREWMIGEPGLARGSVDPDGIVVVRGAPWRAHTNRATPIADGEPVTVVALEGMTLEVAPDDGSDDGSGLDPTDALDTSQK